MNSKKKISLDEIFNDDEFGLLDLTVNTSNTKTEDDRLIDSFEEINTFVDKNKREPNATKISEYGLLARLKSIRQNERQKTTLKPFDRHNLLGEVALPKTSIDDVLQDDEFGLLDTDTDLSIFKYKHIPREDERAEADFVAQRKRFEEAEFARYELMFHQVHKEIKEGKREIRPFYSLERNLQVGNFYILDGVMLYLESANLDEKLRGMNTGNRVQVDGRTKTIFENGTYSNMLFRSLGKQIQKSGKLITNTNMGINNELYINSGTIDEQDIQTGWIYILRSKSLHPEIIAAKDLYKIGFSTIDVAERIRFSAQEATYLYSDVEVVASYACYNLNTQQFEKLVHRFFGECCMNVDVFDKEGKRYSPREWFIVPLSVIEQAIDLIISRQIVHFKYDPLTKLIINK